MTLGEKAGGAKKGKGRGKGRGGGEAEEERGGGATMEERVEGKGRLEEQMEPAQPKLTVDILQRNSRSGSPLRQPNPHTPT